MPSGSSQLAPYGSLAEEIEGLWENKETICNVIQTMPSNAKCHCPDAPSFSVARDPLDRPQQPDLLRIDRDQARPFRCGFEPSVTSLHKAEDGPTLLRLNKRARHARGEEEPK